MKKIINWILKHKIVSISALLVLLVLGFYSYQKINSKSSSVQYVTEEVKTGSLAVSVSGTGQVSSLETASIMSEVSGNILSINVKSGQEVQKGALVARIDDSEALKSLTSAEIALESAKLALEELQEPAEELSLLQAESALIQAQESKETAESNIEKSHEDSFNIVANTFLDLPTLMIGLKDILFGYTACPNAGVQENYSCYGGAASIYDDRALEYKQEVYEKYQIAKSKYDEIQNLYKETNRYSEDEEIENLIDETYETTKIISDSIKSTINLIDFYKYVLTLRSINFSSVADTHLTSLSSYTSKTNQHLSNLLSATQSIETYEKNLVSAERTIKEKQLSLDKLKEGPGELEIRSQELTISQKEADLLDTEEDLADCYVYAPFNGIITGINVEKGDAVSSGTALASLITKQNVVEVTLNEIDIANVKVGQKAVVTFDNFEDLSVEGEVYQLDLVGTVSQGVVSYSVDIIFSSDDERIKPGMSVTANIIEESVTGVIVITSSAVKTRGDSNYVEVLSNGIPEKKNVETGLSNDTSVEIKSGLSAGDKVITKTIISSVKSSAGSTTDNGNSILNNGGIIPGNREMPSGGGPGGM
jgi:HlyD family secretion protein